VCVYRTDRSCRSHPSCTVHASLMQPVGACCRADCHPGRSGGWTRDEKMGRTVAGQSAATAVADNAIAYSSNNKTMMIMIAEGHAASDTSAVCQRRAPRVPPPCTVHPSRLCNNILYYYFAVLARTNLKRRINSTMFR